MHFCTRLNLFRAAGEMLPNKVCNGGNEFSTRFLDKGEKKNLENKKCKQCDFLKFRIDRLTCQLFYMRLTF